MGLLVVFEFGIPVADVDKAAVGGRVDVFVFAGFGVGIDENDDASSILGVFASNLGVAMPCGDPFKGRVGTVHDGSGPPEAHAVIPLGIANHHVLDRSFDTAALESAGVNQAARAGSDAASIGRIGEKKECVAPIPHSIARVNGGGPTPFEVGKVLAPAAH